MSLLASVPIAAWQSIAQDVGPWFYWSGLLMGFALVPVILLSHKVPQAKVAWIFLVLGFPWAGAVFYFGIGRSHLQRKVVRLRGQRGASVARVRDPLGRVPAPTGTASQLVLGASRVGAAAPVPGNELTLLAKGPEAFAAAHEAIEAARDHVHLLTYIFKDDGTGQRAIDSLVAAAKRGVEVRVLYDGLGTFHTKASFFDPIRKAGGEVSSFLPFTPFVSGFRLNLRNHRKLLVTDGHTAHLGGMNVGDEYATGTNWHDVNARLRGPVVPSLQRVFVEDWHFATGRLLDAERYFPVPAPVGEVPVQVVASGPDQEDPHAEELMFSAVAAADRSVDILTPYLVPTEPLEQALVSAVRRGRRVRVLLPGFVDHIAVRWATDAYVGRLIERGVEVWRHPMMVHGKLVIVDGQWVTLGSTNLDMRSLRLNFELNVAIPHAPTAAEITRYFESELAAARKLGVEDYRANVPTRLLRAAAHLFSPVL